MKQISVIILSYNNLIYLKQAIDSVLMQRYGDIQLIVADDASSEFDFDEVEKHIENNKSDNLKDFKVFSNSKNLGTVKNLNEAVKNATGEIILPFAADDVLYDTEVLTNFIQVFDEIGDDGCIVTSQVEKYDAQLKKSISCAISGEQIRLLQSGDFRQIYGSLSLSCFIPSGGTVYRRSVFQQFGLFNEEYRLIEDWPFFLKLTRNKVVIHYGDFTSVKHRDGGVSTINGHSPSRNQYQLDLINIMKDEILQNVDFAHVIMQKKIQKQCQDKILFFELRYNFSGLSNSGKIKYIVKNIRLIPAIARGVKRRISGNGY